jgi:hypothetical protein
MRKLWAASFSKGTRVFGRHLQNPNFSQGGTMIEEILNCGIPIGFRAPIHSWSAAHSPAVWLWLDGEELSLGIEEELGERGAQSARVPSPFDD